MSRHQMGYREWMGLLVLVTLTGCATPGPVSTLPTEFQDGIAAYQQGDYRAAEMIFNRLISKYIGTPFLAEVQWMLARAIEGQMELGRALTQYELFVQNYPADPHRLEADLKIKEVVAKLYPWKRDRQIRLGAVIDLSGGRSIGSLQKWLGQLERVGVDTLVVKVFQEEGPNKPSGVYFQTPRAPVLMDSLGALIKMAQRHQMRLLVWMSVRKMDWKLKTSPKWADLKHDASRKVFASSGSLDLFQPAVRDYITALYLDLGRYPIDGIVFGEDLFYKTEEGLSEAARDQFAEAFGDPLWFNQLQKGSFTGLLFQDNHTFWRWAGWKSRQSYDFLNGLIEAIRETYPSLQLVILHSDETVLNPLNALAQYSQDLLEAKRLKLDYYMITLKTSSVMSLPGIVDKANRQMGRPEKVLMRVRVADPVSTQFQHEIASVTEMDTSAILRLSALSPKMGLKFFEFFFRPHEPAISTPDPS